MMHHVQNDLGDLQPALAKVLVLHFRPDRFIFEETEGNQAIVLLR